VTARARVLRPRPAEAVAPADCPYYFSAARHQREPAARFLPQPLGQQEHPLLGPRCESHLPAPARAACRRSPLKHPASRQTTPAAEAAASWPLLDAPQISRAAGLLCAPLRLQQPSCVAAARLRRRRPCQWELSRLHAGQLFRDFFRPPARSKKHSAKWR
jgi:hypothetical protein